MTPEAADWVYRHVLTDRLKESSGAIMWTGSGPDRRDEGRGAAMLRTCRCQYGRCHRCLLGSHDGCTGIRVTGPAARVLDRTGLALAEVWPSGRPCAWQCPCGCRGVGQLELFALAGGAR